MKAKYYWILLILLLFTVENINAESCTPFSGRKSSFTSDYNKFDTEISYNNDKTWYIYKYYGSMDELVSGMTAFCLSPGLYNPGKDGSYPSDYYIDVEFALDCGEPSKYQLAMNHAFTAIETAYNTGKFENGVASYVLSELIYRVISMKYSEAGGYEDALKVPFLSFDDYAKGFTGLKGSGIGARRLEEAKKIINNAVAFAEAYSGKTYEEIAANSGLPLANFLIDVKKKLDESGEVEGHESSSSSSTTTGSDGTLKKEEGESSFVNYYIEVRPNFKEGEKFDYKQYDNGKHYTLTVKSGNAKIDEIDGVENTADDLWVGLTAMASEVTLDISQTDGKPIILEYCVEYYSPYSASTNIVKLRSTGEGKTEVAQYMLGFSGTASQNATQRTFSDTGKIYQKHCQDIYLDGKACKIHPDGTAYLHETEDGVEKEPKRLNTYQEMVDAGCPLKCMIVTEGNGKKVYVGPEGEMLEEQTKEAFEDACGEKICEIVTDKNGNKKYYDSKGKEVSKKAYDEDPKCINICEMSPTEAKVTPEEWAEQCCDEIPKNEQEKNYYYQKYCTDHCDPDVYMPSDCYDVLQDNTEIEITDDVEGYIKDLKEENKDYTKICIISDDDFPDKTDYAENAFKIDKTTFLLKDNDYCMVSCKEDYVYSVPGARYAESGSYFTLTTKITATRDCYSSEINFKKFIKDYQELYTNLINKYNLFSIARENLDNFDPELVEEHNETYYTSCNTSNGACSLTGERTCNSTYTYSGPKIEYDFIEWTKEFNKVPSPDQETGRITNKKHLTNQPGANVSVGNVERGSESCTYQSEEDEDCTCDCNPGSCSPAEFGDVEKELQRRYDEALLNLHTAQTKLNQKLSDMLNCSRWSNNQEMKPIIDFTYDEKEYSNEFDEPFELVGELETQATDTYCEGETKGDYSCLGNETKSMETFKLYYAHCTEDYPCDNEYEYISVAPWLYKQKISSGEYQSTTKVSVYSPTGTIVFDAETKENGYGKGTYGLLTDLPEGSMPIKLLTKTGVYNYEFTYKDFGQFNDELNKLGRLVGDEKSVYAAWIEDGNSPNGKDEKSKTTELDTTASYVCHYIINCDECEYECVGKDCYITGDNDKDSSTNKETGKCVGECIHKCINCIFDGTESNYSFRSISLTNVFPDSKIDYSKPNKTNPNNSGSNNGTNKGPNNNNGNGNNNPGNPGNPSNPTTSPDPDQPQTSTTRIYETNWSSEKGITTVYEIEKKGELIYSGKEDIGKLEYSYRINPNQMENIKGYNKDAISYTNINMPDSSDTALVCDAEGNLAGIRCISLFLEENDTNTKYFIRLKRNTDWICYHFDDSCSYGEYGSGIGPAWK